MFEAIAVGIGKAAGSFAVSRLSDGANQARLAGAYRQAAESAIQALEESHPAGSDEWNRLVALLQDEERARRIADSIAGTAPPVEHVAADLQPYMDQFFVLLLGEFVRIVPPEGRPALDAILVAIGIGNEKILRALAAAEGARVAQMVPAAIPDPVYDRIGRELHHRIHIDQWETWTNNATYTHPELPEVIANDIQAFRLSVLRAPWPGTSARLETALQAAATELDDFSRCFTDSDDMRSEGGSWIPSPRYKDAKRRGEFELSDDLAENYEQSLADKDVRLRSATAHLNLCLELLSTDVDPAFMPPAGFLILRLGPYMDESTGVLREYVGVPQLTKEERQALLKDG